MKLKRKKKLVYLLFLFIGILLILISIIVKDKFNIVIYDTINQLGVVVLSITIIWFLWETFGGEPLSEQITDLKNLNKLYLDSEKSGLQRVYLKSPNLDSIPWNDLIKESQKYIDLSGHTLYAIVNNSISFNLLKDRIENNVKVRVLLNHPENPAIKLAIDYDHQNIKTMQEQMQFTYNKLIEFKEHLHSKLKNNLEIIRIKNEVLHTSIRRFDNKLFVVHYLYSTRTSDNPTFYIEGIESSLFQLYLYDFEHLFIHYK
jgi:hypothetical protein